MFFLSLCFERNEEKRRAIGKQRLRVEYGKRARKNSDESGKEAENIFWVIGGREEKQRRRTRRKKKRRRGTSEEEITRGIRIEKQRRHMCVEKWV